jgi:hypothetical protein
MIGGYESAFLADLEATYDIFDKLSDLMTKHVKFLGTYCEDELIIF